MAKSEKRKRQLFINIRVTDIEKKKFLQRCNDSGLSTGDYFRMKCLDEKPLRARRRISANKKELLRLRLQLSKAGNNLNQIAKKLNAGDGLFATDHTQLREALRDFVEISDLIRSELGYDS